MPQTGVQNNGPKAGNGNRNRNTLRNNASKTSGYPGIPPLSPSGTVEFAEKLATLRGDYLTQLAQLRMDSRGARAQYRLDKANVLDARRTDLAAAANDAIERGVFGSSADIEARAGIRAEAVRALAEARSARNARVQAARQGKLLANNNYNTSVLATLADKRAAQAEAAAQSFQNDEFDSGGGGKTGNKAGDIAAAQLGAPYIWADLNPVGKAGGAGSGFDCSGLSKYVYEKAYGIELPHMASQQQAMLNRVGRDQLRPGDLLFFNFGRKAPGVADHVGIYLGNGMMIDASSSEGRVVRRPVFWSNFINGGRA